MGQLKRSKKYAKKMGEAYTGRPARPDAKVANPEMAEVSKSKRTKFIEKFGHLLVGKYACIDVPKDAELVDPNTLIVKG